jgi:hypothetical protein
MTAATVCSGSWFCENRLEPALRRGRHPRFPARSVFTKVQIYHRRELHAATALPMGDPGRFHAACAMVILLAGKARIEKLFPTAIIAMSNDAVSARL